MRVAIAVASLLAALLIFMRGTPCPRHDGPDERLCRDTACAQAARSAVGWAFSNRFSLLNLPRLTFPLLRDAADGNCWS